MSEVARNELSAEQIDAQFPLQQPGGVAQNIKQLLAEGETAKAQDLYQHLRMLDQGAVEHRADELLVEHSFDPFELNVLRALRLGLQAGILIGRQEGANVVAQLLRRAERAGFKAIALTVDNTKA